MTTTEPAPTTPLDPDAIADVVGAVARTIDQGADAIRTGEGVPFAAYGVHDMQAVFTRPAVANALVPAWLPQLPDVHARRQAGFAAVDVLPIEHPFFRFYRLGR